MQANVERKPYIARISKSVCSHINRQNEITVYKKNGEYICRKCKKVLSIMEMYRICVCHIPRRINLNCRHLTKSQQNKLRKIKGAIIANPNDTAKLIIEHNISDIFNKLDTEYWNNFDFASLYKRKDDVNEQ